MREVKLTYFVVVYISLIGDDLLKFLRSNNSTPYPSRGIFAKIFATQMGSSVIDTQYGKLRGVLTTLTNRQLPQVESYLGLQYAYLRGGELRFMPPTSTTEKWEGVRVALSFRPVCPQRVPSDEELEDLMPKWRIERISRIRPFLERQSEECLNLNIYVPVRSKSDTVPLPVVVLIISESYDFGSPNAYDVTVMAAEMKVIAIAVNFRLGSLGFLSTEDGHARGNYALLDLTAALIWIQENIVSFGGNPGEVTLMGQGFGANLVSLLMLSSLTKGFFHRVILQSGSAFSPQSIVTNPLTNTRHLAQALNCSSQDPSDEMPAVLQCLKQVSYEALVAARVPTSPYKSAFGPTVDGRMVPAKDFRYLMTNSAEDSSLINISVLAGFTHMEGYADLSQKIIDNRITADELREKLVELINSAFQHHRQTIYDIILHQYRKWDLHQRRHHQNGLASSSDLAEIVGDYLRVMSVTDLARLRAESSRSRGRISAGIYLYCFNYSSTALLTSGLTSGAGASLGDDLIYILGAPLSDGLDPFPWVYSQDDKTFSRNIMSYWANFIHTGNPNERREKAIEKKSVLHHWPPYDVFSQQLLLLDLKPTVERNYRADKVALWLSLLPKIQSAPYDPNHNDSCLHLLEDSNNLTSFEPGHVMRAYERDCLTRLGVTKPPVTVKKDLLESSKRAAARSPINSTKDLWDRIAVAPPGFDLHNTTEQNNIAMLADESPASRKSQISNSGQDYGVYLIVVLFSGGLLLVINTVILISCVIIRRSRTRRKQLDLSEDKDEQEEEIRLREEEFRPVNTGYGMMTSRIHCSNMAERGNGCPPSLYDSSMTSRGHVYSPFVASKRTTIT